MSTVPVPEDHDPAFMPMYVELDGLRHIPGFPNTKPIAHALLVEAETAYHAGDIAKALGLVWDAGAVLYRDAYVAAPKIMRANREPGGKETQLAAIWKRCYQSVRDFRDWKTREQRKYLQDHHPAAVEGVVDPDRCIRRLRGKARE